MLCRSAAGAQDFVCRTSAALFTRRPRADDREAIEEHPHPAAGLSPLQYPWAHSGAPDPSSAPQFGAPENAAVPAPPAKKRGKWFIAAGCGCLAIIALAIAGCTAIAATSSGGDGDTAPTTEVAPEITEEEIVEQEAAEDVADTEAEAVEPADEPVEEPAAAEDDVPAEHTSALNSAESYSELLHMSKQGIFHQLTSEYGDQFTEEQAQYAIDTIEADWNQNALESARSYRDTMDMSPEAIRDQLSSPYGDQFTQEQADYAVENLDG